MKNKRVWILSAVALAVLVVGGSRLLSKRKAAALSSPTTASATARVELAQNDVLIANVRDLTLSLPISGTVQATATAMIKAKVTGELLKVHVREGDAVHAGQVIAEVDPTEYQARVRQAQQQADAAQAQVSIAQRQYDNNNALVQQGFISSTALQNSLASLQTAQANHAATVAALDIARKSLQDARLTSPIAGVVSQRLMQPGERVAPEARIAEVVNLSQLELQAALSAEDAAQVKVGMQAQLHAEGVNAPIAARVLRINPSAQVGSRSVLVYLGMQGQTGLRHGVFAQGELGTQTVKTMAVPVSAVRTNKPEPYVQVVQEGKVAHIPVKPGPRALVDGQAWTSVEGLSEGAQVLLASAGTVAEGTTVQFTGANPAPAK
ncbi:MAG: Nickel and cobalt resistance protein CnrB [Pseudomonadota bacterium]|jgi:RND family efflux transporter MFP subunit